MNQWPWTGLICAALVTLCGCSQNGGQTASTSPPPATPLATAVIGPDGTWATLPVGDTTNPAKTYWQLLHLPAGSNRWENDVAATATATNGGIDLATTPTGVIAGVRPSQNLTFSPLVQTDTGGRTWTDGLLPAGLAGTPQALAVSATGAKLAIVGSAGTDQQIDTTTTDITQWTTTATTHDLASASPCDPTAIEAAAYLNATPLIGTACATPGIAGVFKLTGANTAQQFGPAIPPTDTAEILALSTTPDRLAILLQLRHHNQVSLQVATADLELQNWAESTPLGLDPNTQVSSITAEQGAFLVLVHSTETAALYTLHTPGDEWQQQPAPPAGTAAVTALPDGHLSALVPSATTVTIWDLPPTARHWQNEQGLNVPILYTNT